MRLLNLSIILVTFFSCAMDKSSKDFFDNCTESSVDLSNGIRVYDSLGYFSLMMPDSSWMPKRYVGENTTGLTIGDVSSDGHLYIFNASHSYYTGEWDWGKEQANVENDFNVIKTGKVHLLGQSRPLNIVHFQVDSPQTISFYISIIDTLNRSNYTLNLTTDYGEGYESRICEMKPILESLKIHQ